MTTFRRVLNNPVIAFFLLLFLGAEAWMLLAAFGAYL